MWKIIQLNNSTIVKWKKGTPVTTTDTTDTKTAILVYIKFAIEFTVILFKLVEIWFKFAIVTITTLTVSMLVIKGTQW